MKFYPTLVETLENRFDDPSEIHDVVNHGMNCGFSGFTYSSELYEFFEEFESEIEDHLEDMGITLNDLVADTNSWTFQEVREQSVWTVVASWCCMRVNEMDEAA